MGKCIDTYKEVREFHYPDMIVRVHIPDITPEERARRMKQIHNAASDLLKSVIEQGVKKCQQQQPLL